MADQPEFFIDRSLGRKAVPEALRACGLVVHTMASVYGEKVAQGLRDETWLRDVGQRGWVVLMKDDAIRRRPAGAPPCREPPSHPAAGVSAGSVHLRCVRGPY